MIPDSNPNSNLDRLLWQVIKDTNWYDAFEQWGETDIDYFLDTYFAEHYHKEVDANYREIFKHLLIRLGISDQFEVEIRVGIFGLLIGGIVFSQRGEDRGSDGSWLRHLRRDRT